MKKLFTLLLLALAFPALAGTFNCRWNFTDFTASPHGVKQVKLQTIAAYGTSSSNIITGDLRVYMADANGSLTVSNLANGRSYRVTFTGPNFTTTFTNSFDTNVTGTVSAVDYIAPPLVSDTSAVAFSQAGADARFHNVSGDTSTNAVFRGTFKIPAGAVVNYVLTATNADGSAAWAAATGGGGGTGLTNWYEVKDYGAVGNGSTDDSAAITNAIAAIPSTGGVLLLNSGGTYLSSTNITIPSKAFVIFEPGARLVAGSGKTITFNAAFTAPPAQYIFSTNGNFSFSGNQRPGDLVHAEWFGVVADGNGTTGTDNLPALYNLNRYLYANDGLKVTFPTGTICTSNPRWLMGVRNAHLDFAGVTGQNIVANPDSLYENFFLQVGGGMNANRLLGSGTEQSRPMPQWIQTTAAGASTVTLVINGFATNHWPGQWVQIAGYEVQGSGYPPSFRYNEYRKVVSVVTNTGVITLDRPLENAYRSDWYVNPTDGNGPAGILPLDREPYARFGEKIVVENLTTIANTANTPSTNTALNVFYSSSMVTGSGVREMIFRNVKCSQMFVGDCERAILENCEVDEFQPDKQGVDLIVKNCRFGAIVEGTGFRRIKVYDSSARNYFALYPSELLHVENCDFLYATNEVTTAGSSFALSQSVWKNNRWYLTPNSKEALFSGFQTEAGATYHDAPGPFVTVALTANASQFTTDATQDSYILRRRLGRGSVLTTSAGKRAVVTEITYDAVNTNFVVAYTADEPIQIGDRLYYYLIQTLVAEGNTRVNGSRGVPQNIGYDLPAQNYVNPDDGIGLRESEVVWSDYDPSTFWQLPVHGYVSEIEVNVQRAYTGVGDARFVVAFAAPYATSDELVINTAVEGKRLLRSSGLAEGFRSTDTWEPLGQKMLHNLSLKLLGADNSGALGAVVSTRVKWTRRDARGSTTNQAGANVIIAGQPGTGTETGGSLIFSTAGALGTSGQDYGVQTNQVTLSPTTLGIRVPVVVTNTVTANNFVGGGSGLTNLNYVLKTNGTSYGQTAYNPLISGNWTNSSVTDIRLNALNGIDLTLNKAAGSQVDRINFDIAGTTYGQIALNSDGNFRFQSTVSGTPVLVNANNSYVWLNGGTGGADALRVDANNTRAMTVDQSGNVTLAGNVTLTNTAKSFSGNGGGLSNLQVYIASTPTISVTTNLGPPLIFSLAAINTNGVGVTNLFIYQSGPTFLNVTSNGFGDYTLSVDYEPMPPSANLTNWSNLAITQRQPADAALTNVVNLGSNSYAGTFWGTNFYGGIFTGDGQGITNLNNDGGDGLLMSAGGITGTATTSSDVAGKISDEQGTGKLVFNTNATMTSLGVTNNLTLNGAAINTWDDVTNFFQQTGTGETLWWTNSGAASSVSNAYAVKATSFTGSGAGLTGLNPTNISSGYSSGLSIGGNAVTATTATTANAGDSATSFFPSGTIEPARLATNAAANALVLKATSSTTAAWQADSATGPTNLINDGTAVYLTDTNGTARWRSYYDINQIMAANGNPVFTSYQGVNQTGMDPPVGSGVYIRLYGSNGNMLLYSTNTVTIQGNLNVTGTSSYSNMNFATATFTNAIFATNIPPATITPGNGAVLWNSNNILYYVTYNNAGNPTATNAFATGGAGSTEYVVAGTNGIVVVTSGATNTISHTGNFTTMTVTNLNVDTAYITNLVATVTNVSWGDVSGKPAPIASLSTNNGATITNVLGANYATNLAGASLTTVTNAATTVATTATNSLAGQLDAVYATDAALVGATNAATITASVNATNAGNIVFKPANNAFTGSNNFGGNTTFALPPLGKGSGLTNLLADDAYGVASTNWVLQQVASIGTHIYSSGVTNAAAMTNSAAGEFGWRTNIWYGSNSPVATVTTNTVNVLATDQYLRHIKSAQTFTRIADGPISVNAYIAKSAGAGTTAIKPEFYWLLNSTQMVEFASATAQTITGATPTRYEWSVSVPSTNLPAASEIVWAWKVTSVGSASPALQFVSGGAYDSHATLVQNIASASIAGAQVTGTVPAATNAANATNFWGTLSTTNLPATFSATSAANATNFWGQLNVSNYNSGTSASSSTYLRGDGTWATPAGGGSSAYMPQTIEYFDDLMNFEPATSSLTGPLGLRTILTSSAATSASADDAHPGVITFSTGTSASAIVTFHTSKTSLEATTGSYTNEWLVRVPTVSDDTEYFIVRVGFGDDTTNFMPADGAQFMYSHGTNSGKWQAVVSGGSTRSYSDTGLTMSAGTWYKLKVALSGGTAYFWTNGVLSTTLTGANVPGDNEFFGVSNGIAKFAGTTARTVDFDYCYLGIGLNASR